MLKEQCGADPGQLHMDDDIAHLDISNIMMRKDKPDAWDEVRVLDFGLAGTVSLPGFTANVAISD